MTDYETCGECERPMRPQRARKVDHPATISVGTGGLCSTCTGRKTVYEGRHGKPVDPHVTAINSGQPVTAFVVFPQPVYQKQHPVECRVCHWGTHAVSAVSARQLAYKHFNKYLKEENDE